MPTCDYCTSPITGGGHAGRPWPHSPPVTYCCYGCLSLGEQRRQEAASPALPGIEGNLGSLGARLGIGILVVGQSMIFGLALDLHDDIPTQVRWLTQTLILCATVLVIALLGGPLAAAAWRELRRGHLTIEALFLLTMTGAMAASLQAHITGHGKIYFEVVSILLVVYTLGKAIGARSRGAALAGSRAWAGQLETCRLVDTQGRARVVRVVEVRPGDRVEVNPGETIAVDGVIRDGIGFVTEAPVSGEAFAVVRRPGDRVLAGAASLDAAFRIEATARGTERQVDRLLAAVEEARDRPVSLQAQADHLGRWFFPIVLITALGTFGYWTMDTGWETGLFNSMSVLLVACPCVIGLATPIIIWSALGRLAERGLIVRTGDMAERLAEVDCVLLDKTGTLTDDSFALLDIATSATGDKRAQLLGWLALVEERGDHPVARPFARLSRRAGESSRVLALRAVPGCGVQAEIESDGECHSIQIGTPSWIGATAQTTHERELTLELKASGHLIHVALDGELVAVAVLAERLRDSARDAISAFRQLGLPVAVLTGDSAERATALDLPATRPRMLPDDKRAAVELARAKGEHPLFVGDGINDASALAAAHVGIALWRGADIAIAAADATLYHGDLRALPWAVELSREAVRAVRRSLHRALAYNLVGMSLAAGGMLHPLAAVLLMVLSSLSLVYRATRVGVFPARCGESAVACDRPVRRDRVASTLRNRAMGHGLAIAFQGIIFLLLLDAARDFPRAMALLGVFALAGGALAYLWYRWTALPHALDMCVGMVSFGNLGMLLGWWADNGFAALRDGNCRACVDAMRGGVMKPWMWIGMLAFANGAMIWLQRRPVVRRRDHTRAMFTGGNIGMALGMLAGGWCAARIGTTTMAAAVFTSFAGMTVGMLVGMLLGTWLMERLIETARTFRSIPTWLRAGGVTSSAG